MLKIKIGSALLALTMALGILGGCGSKPAGNQSANTQAASTKPSSTQAASSQPSSSSGKLVDGVYKVEYDNFDSHDYKPQIEVTISGGKITDVKYEEVKKDGSPKSKDEQYKKQMEAQSKTYPDKAYKELIKKLIDKQSSEIDTVTGATASTKTFKELAKNALEMAKKGTTTPAKIPLSKQ